ncbi:hypothetical protein CSC94_21400 [Zhengella mangrovi]|uniref:Fibronectin-binding protein n=2 Tax=Zhengella mangrovi TaxID=1982044 RepID=A0A2G1QI13_9HYPH|nr:hypothetical protein CSC94_21400 [Zhengella mangrovi]
MKTPVAATLAVMMTCGLAIADPTGTYDVEGMNPDNGRTYHGTVTVRRTGQTYSVVWDIAGSRYIGTGLGATIAGGQYTVGPASADNTTLSIGYVSGRTFGQAFYIQQPDGSWSGIWTYGGSKLVSTEEWYPR